MAKISHRLEPRWLLITAFFISGILLGGLTVYLWLNIGAVSAYKIHSLGVSYKYIDPLLAVEVPGQRGFSQNKAMISEIQGLIDAAKRDGLINEAAVYFRDIEPGVWSGVNESYKFSPGKLLKVPIMIAYFKLAESNSGILDREIAFTGNEPSSELFFGPKESLKVGQSYTVQYLIEKMIVDSDDNAANLLFDNIDNASLDEIFSDLGINFNEEKYTQDFISLKLYSLFFRVLYNSTYLNREYSEKALELLVRADNSVGVGADLPKNIPLANRLGARQVANGGATSFEMYDCGIVYYPSHPFLLCSVARGRDLKGIESFFRELGRQVYSEIDYQYKS